MFDLIIRRALLPNEQLVDIAIKEGKIAAVGSIKEKAVHEQDLAGNYYVSAGWIDSHVHCYPKSPIYYDEPDKVGVAGGVTTVIDAGSTGANDIDDFYHITREAITQVYALINISRVGIAQQNELADLDNIDENALRRAIARLPEFIIGLKARMSRSVVGANGIVPLQRAKAIQSAVGALPLMVHIGNAPPELDDIADLLTAGDIITHCYNGKPNRILTAQGLLRESIKRATQRGVKLDIGHGTESFSFAVARQAIAQGILPDTISSDIYCRNRIHGPVRSLAHIMSKFFSMGMTLSQVIDCVTRRAAHILGLESKGVLQPGYDADLTIFSIKQQPTMFEDAEGGQILAERNFVAHAVLVAGEWHLTDTGKANHDFNL